MIRLHSLKRLLMLIFFVSLLLNNITSAKSSDHRHDEIGYKVLDIEKRFSDRCDSNAYYILDKILDDAEKEIKPLLKKKYSLKECYRILMTIDSVLKLNVIEPYTDIGNFRYAYDNWIISFYCFCLTEKKFYCNPYVITYLSIAERMNLPLFNVTAPEHIFLLWDDGNNYFYWEATDTTLIKVRNTDFYMESFRIHPNSIINGVYLKKNANNSIISYVYSKLSVAETKDIFKALEYTSNAMDIDTNNLDSYVNRAIILGKMSMHAECIEYCDKAIQLDPNCLKAYWVRASSLIVQSMQSLYKGGSNKLPDRNVLIQCVNDLLKIIELKESDWRQSLLFNDELLYCHLGSAYYLLGEYEKALTALNKSILDYPESNGGSAYYFRSRVYYKQGREYSACTELLNACEHGFKAACSQWESTCK